MAIENNDVSAFMIEEALRQKYPSPAWVYMPELRCGPAANAHNDKESIDNRRRMDGFAMSMHPNKNLKRIGFEIKVTRMDFLREMNGDSEKRMPAMSLTNEFYYVVPKGMVKVDEIPKDCGLMEYHPYPDDFVKIVKRAQVRDSQPPTWEFVASLLRRHDILRTDIIIGMQNAVLGK